LKLLKALLYNLALLDMKLQQLLQEAMIKLMFLLLKGIN